MSLLTNKPKTPLYNLDYYWFSLQVSPQYNKHTYVKKNVINLNYTMQFTKINLSVVTLVNNSINFNYLLKYSQLISTVRKHITSVYLTSSYITQLIKVSNPKTYTNTRLLTKCTLDSNILQLL